MSRRVVASVPVTADGERLDRFVGALAEVGSRARARHLIERGLVEVDGVRRKPAFAIAPGMAVSVEVPAEAPIEAVAQDIPVDVLHADADIVVVDKPAGMVVHPAAGAREGTLVNALLHRFATLGAGEPERPGIVHRLDRDTSGVMVVARTHQALEHLARQFRARTVEKVYWGLARGRVAKTEGLLTWSVGRHPTQRQRMSVASRRGRTASTAFQVRERLPGATILELRPKTGRTHQIRVHLAALGHPLVGDRVYGARGAGRAVTAPWVTVLARCPRHALHAVSIAFRHPRDERAMRFEVAVPADLAAVVEALRAIEPRVD